MDDKITSNWTINTETPLDKAKKARRWTQYLAALIANLGTLSIGSLLGWTSQAGPELLDGRAGIGMSMEELSWVAGCMPLGAALATGPVPFLLHKYGRKPTLMIFVVPFIIGFAVLAWANSVATYCVGRLITGFCGGAFSIVAPVYTAEIGEKEIRGALGTYYEFMLAVGVEYSYIVGGFVSVFWLSIICGVVPIVFAAVFVFMPESPYFLLNQGKEEEAVKSLIWLRGPDYDFEEELREMKESISKTKDEKLSWSSFMTPAAKRSMIVGAGLMLFLQMNGPNAVVFNTTLIFEQAGSEFDPVTATMVVGFMQFLGNFLSTLLVDRLGRRFLLLISGLFMGLCTMLLGVYFHLLIHSFNIESINWLPILSLCVFMIMFSIGWGPVAWMMMGEIFPSKIKPVASAGGSFINWISTFIVTKFYPDFVFIFGEDVTFWIFAVISAISMFFVFYLVPETKGKTFDEIQMDLAGENKTKSAS